MWSGAAGCVSSSERSTHTQLVELTCVGLLFFFLYIDSFIASFYYYYYLFIYGCVGSLFLREGFLQLRQAGTTLHRGARASHYRGLSC